MGQRTGEGAGPEWLRGELAALAERGGPERRHETLLERAEGWGVERPEAELVYGLAEEAGLEPELALLLRASGLGVVELQEVGEGPTEAGQQQAPPAWVEPAAVPPEAARRERRLRLSFRRLAALLAESASPVEAVERFRSEPDVVEAAY